MQKGAPQLVGAECGASCDPSREGGFLRGETKDSSSFTALDDGPLDVLMERSMDRRWWPYQVRVLREAPAGAGRAFRFAVPAVFDH